MNQCLPYLGSLGIVNSSNPKEENAVHRLSQAGTGTTLLYSRRSFTIHGYWPQQSTTQDFGRFDVNAVSPILSRLLKAWPPQAESSGYQYFLWQHEWTNHGKDFAAIYKHLSGSQISNLDLQKHYFADTLGVYNQVRGHTLQKNPTSKADLAKQLGIAENTFYTRCLDSSGNIQEIRVCTLISKQSGKIVYQITKCSRVSDNCKGKVQLKGFRQ